MFALVNVVRKHKLDPEAVLRAANNKFERRFRAVEQALNAIDKTPEQSDLAEMDALWQQVKRQAG
jgi:ATP diphosphatase